MDQPWIFMEFVTLGGRGVITEWIEKEIEIEAEINFHARLLFLSLTERLLWTRPEYAPLDSEISEIRFKGGKLQHRVFGFFLMDAMQYVMLVGSTKKGRLYTPKDAIETARKRRKIILANRKQLNEYEDYQF